MRFYNIRLWPFWCFYMSCGVRTFPNIPHLNNSDNILFLFKNIGKFQSELHCAQSVLWKPLLLVAAFKHSFKMAECQWEDRCSYPYWKSVLWCWWLNRQLSNRSFEHISLKSTSILKGRTKLKFLLLDLITFLSLHSPCHRCQWH